LDGKHGFLTQGWETLDLSEDVLVNTLLTWGGAGAGDVSSASIAATCRPLSDTDGMVLLSTIIWFSSSTTFSFVRKLRGAQSTILSQYIYCWRMCWENALLQTK
jgi:hypothetical protein